MFIDRFMAGDTFFRRTFKCCADMTRITGHSGVQTGQRKCGFRMIKREFFFPAGFVVAVLALLTLLTFVYVVEFVAAIAIFGQCVVNIGAMAGIARGIAVFAAQQKLGVAIVIELLFRP
jgi:hypothetical protein